MTKDQNSELKDPMIEATMTRNSFKKRIALKIRKILPILNKR
eukprot:CAMPEP_0115316388 /NCGR_PEP_ID=MMETSP0270-20121206/78099_1 /TAXON_ID=71861 /ORGANISM="Scrippsiella trochoidea, Strain CCMP3099" /LENGTH=41 /DNA_ID= /DNA_START= /DNA_END= /DNA_ORIENTATION=